MFVALHMFSKLNRTINKNIFKYIFEDNLIKRADVCGSFIVLQALCIDNYTFIHCGIFFTDRIHEHELKNGKLRKLMHST